MGIGVSLRGEECESSGHDLVLLLFRISDSDIQTTFPGSTSAMTYFSVKGNYASSTKELWRVFPLKQQTFWPGSLLYEEAIKTSVITIWRATKFIAMLRPLHFNTKIHTCALKIFLLGKIYCRAGSKETFLKVGTLSVKARAYPRQIKTKNMNFKNAAISSL